jgi:predicted lipoprotein with Yx(FWY)xxD motif
MSGLGTRHRPEGSTQVTYKNRPLYRYSGDTKAGDTNGDGVGGIWHVAKVG